MTETRAPYVIDRKMPKFTVAQETADWPKLLKACTLFVLPASVSEWYAIDDSGLLYANGVDENAFRAMWKHLVSLEKALPRAIGNALNYAERHFNEDLIDELMILSGRRESTLRQYKRVYNPHTGVAPERQRDGVPYSYDREAAPLPPDEQDKLLDRVVAGEFDSSEQVHAERLRIQKETPKETFAPELPVICPICGGQHGWNRARLDWVECADCHAKGFEPLDHLAKLRAAVVHLYKTGDRGPLDAYVADYHVC